MTELDPKPWVTPSGSHHSVRAHFEIGGDITRCTLEPAPGFEQDESFYQYSSLLLGEGLSEAAINRTTDG